MKVLIFVYMLISLSSARELISLNETEILFMNFMMNQITEEDNLLLQDILEIFRRPEPVNVAPLTRSNDIRKWIDCQVCRWAGSALKKAVLNGYSEKFLTKVLSRICSGLGILTYNVCHGAIALNLPIITYIIRSTPEASAEAFCGLILQRDADPLACPYFDPRFDWEVQLPEKTNTTSFLAIDEKPLKVAIITDAHVDLLYEPSGVAACNEPTCCRKGSTAKIFNSLKVNDFVLEKSFVRVEGAEMLNVSIAQELRMKNKGASDKLFGISKPNPAGYWGDYRNCDSPVWTFEDVVDRIKETHKDIDILYYIGDTVDHGVWETSYESNTKVHRYLFDKIKATFGDIMVVPVIGNHESQPINQFAPSTITIPKLNTNWLYNVLADKWKYYLPEQAVTTLRKNGEFSYLVRPGLRVISFNNNVAYKYNWWQHYDPLDSKKHLDWLVQELYSAESKGEKVHILAHIPPGTEDLTHTWTREYNRVVNRFSSTIVAEFNGHTHSDEFRIFYNPEGNPINVAWGGGGIITYSSYNLNYKIVDFNPKTFVPVSIQNFIYNLTEANLTPKKRPRWFLLYNMTDSFGIGDLSPKTMNNLVQSMVTDQQQLLDRYAAFHSKMSDVLWPNCNDACKTDLLCQTVVTVLWDRRKCEELVTEFIK
ncbi:unnamed protein product [Chilo suppressalis]|uniref:Sphingomyelin phosphodiesterase n=1 Tax=Chilo suppressalis TaxID=168631 RepID=A0ABN8BBS5_CHISP|nr:hypothetical protein evm_011822 [Chilo suppressalis]CAH0407381.1 unnamed protein product [Chilo suppressalis]